MLPTKQLTAVTGMCEAAARPLLKRPFPVIFDETCWLYDAVYISGGRRGIQLEVPVERC